MTDGFSLVKVPHPRELFRLIGGLCPSRRKRYLFENAKSLLRKAPRILLLALIASPAPLTLASPEEEYNSLSDQEVTGLITEWASLRPEQRRALLYEIRSRMALRGSSSIQNHDERELHKRSVSGRQYGRQNLVERPIRLSKQSLEIRVRGIKNTGPIRATDSKKHSPPARINSIFSSTSNDSRLRAIKEGGVDYADAPIRFGSGFESRKRVRPGAERVKQAPKKQIKDE